MTPTAPSTARWAADPSRRFAQRFWDGEQWTDFVAGSDGGPPSHDPAPVEIRDQQPDGAASASDPPAAPTDDGVATTEQPAVASDSASAAAGGPPRWDRDPFGRYAQRYWDGTTWTAHVAPERGGAPTTDPQGAAQLGAGPATSSESRGGTDSPSEPNADAGPTPTATTDQADEPAGPSGGGATAAAAWLPDPAGRHPQRYWDGNRWTDFVAGRGGGAPERDPLPIDDAWPVPTTPATTAGSAPESSTPTGAAATVGAATLAAGLASPTGAGPASPEPDQAATSTDTTDVAPGATPTAEEAAPAPAAVPARRRWKRWALIAAALGALIGVAVALLLVTNALGDSTSSSKAARATSPVAATRRPATTAKPAAGATTGARPGTPVAAVDALRNACALLTAGDVANTTGIPAGPGQPLSNGCAWRGSTPLAGSVAAADSYTLGGQEGVILMSHVPTGPPPSMMCTASIPGIPVPGGVCGIAPTEGGSLAMFQAPGNVIVDIRIVSARPTTQAMLETLARIAYTRAA